MNAVTKKAPMTVEQVEMTRICLLLRPAEAHAQHVTYVLLIQATTTTTINMMTMIITTMMLITRTITTTMMMTAADDDYDARDDE